LIATIRVAALVGLAAVLASSSTDATAAEPTFTKITNDGLFKQQPAWSPDGNSLVFARHAGNSILLHIRTVNNRAGTSGADSESTERRLLSSNDPQYDAVFSPDGARLLYAFDKSSPNQGDIEVYSVGLDGKDPTPVAVTRGKLSHEESPCWSPDGKRIAYTSTRDGNQELYVASPDGTGEVRLTSDPAIDAHPAWSPDGKRIAFATNRWGDLEIATITPEGENLQRLTESSGLDDYPAWSPDGGQLAWTSNRTGNFDIHMLDVAGGTLRNVTDHPAIDNFPTWSPDGRLTFVSNRGGGFDIFVEAR